MGIINRFLGLNKYDVALVVGGDTITLASGYNGEPWRMPAYVAVQKPHSRVLAVGEEARKMYGREPENIQAVRFTQNGGFGRKSDLATAALRFALRSQPRSAVVAPRIVAVVSDGRQLEVKNACVQSGCREVITIRAAMAAALGLGLAVDAPEQRAVFVLERDWCAFAMISLSGFVAEFDLPLGIDSLLEDVALHAMATRNVVLDMEALHEAFRVSGLAGGQLLGWESWLDELETGRVTNATYSENDFGRTVLPYLLRLRWHYCRSLESADKSKVRDGSVAPLHFCSPYAKLPGVVQLMQKVFQREVLVPDSSEFAMVRGAQFFIRELDALYRAAK